MLDISVLSLLAFFLEMVRRVEDPFQVHQATCEGVQGDVADQGTYIVLIDVLPMVHRYLLHYDPGNLKRQPTCRMSASMMLGDRNRNPELAKFLYSVILANLEP